MAICVQQKWKRIASMSMGSTDRKSVRFNQFFHRNGETFVEVSWTVALQALSYFI